MNRERAKRHSRWRLPSGVYNPIVSPDGRRWRDYERAAETAPPFPARGDGRPAMANGVTGGVLGRLVNGTGPGHGGSPNGAAGGLANGLMNGTAGHLAMDLLGGAEISLIPPMAILPVLFIVFGLGEVSKVMLIVIGVCPFLIRDILQRTRELPREQLVKAQTLGGNSWQIILRVMLPQIIPRLFDAVRLSLGTAWLFLIAAEAIASTDGLGYRIFLVRRYLSMDIILPYVAWITLLAWLFDWCLLKASRLMFPWYHAEK